MNRSIDGPIDDSMNQEDLIICLARLVVQKLWVPLISDDFRAVSIASRNRLRFASVCEAISEDFGRFREAKIDAKIDFEAIFLDVFLNRVFASIFYRFWEA